MSTFIIPFLVLLLGELAKYFIIKFIERTKLKRLEKNKAKSVEIDFEFI